MKLEFKLCAFVVFEEDSKNTYQRQYIDSLE